LRCGPFSLEDAISLSQLEDSFRYGYWQNFIHPIDSVLLNWAAVVLSDDAEEDVRNGRPLVFSQRSLPTSSGDRCRVYTKDGFFLGVLRLNPETGQWQPEKVFSTAGR
jgi:tRNA U55 pseudouridine synthase TruB